LHVSFGVKIFKAKGIVDPVYKHNLKKVYMGPGDKAPYTLNVYWIEIRCQLYAVALKVKNPKLPLLRRLSGPQTQLGYDVFEKSLSRHQKFNSDHSTHSWSLDRNAAIVV
jgi:hypothetical protein